MYNKDSILCFLNPYSNEESAGKIWQKVHQLSKILPETPTDITKIDDLQSFIELKKPELIVIAGGDGTINRVCAAVTKLVHKPLLAVIPLGFGNAVAHCLGAETVEKACKVINNPHKTLTIDLMKTTLPNFPVGVFSMGIGMDARITHMRMNDRYIGFRSYFVSAVRSLFTHHKREITLTIDNSVTLRGTASSLVVTNSPIIGKNVVISETAKLNSGLLDCTLFSTKYAYLANLRFKGFKHPLYSKENKVYFTAKHIRIEGESYVQVDGDPTMENNPIEIEIMPQQVTFLRNENSQIDLPTLPFIEYH